MTADHCRVYGHEYYRMPCTACRSESLARPDDAPTETVRGLTPEQRETNARGLRITRAALTKEK